MYASVVCNYSSVAYLNVQCAAIPHTKEYCAMSSQSFIMTDVTIKSNGLYRHVHLQTSLLLYYRIMYNYKKNHINYKQNGDTGNY
jgi:hypothetical protein